MSNYYQIVSDVLEAFVKSGFIEMDYFDNGWRIRLTPARGEEKSQLQVPPAPSLSTLPSSPLHPPSTHPSYPPIPPPRHHPRYARVRGVEEPTFFSDEFSLTRASDVQQFIDTWNGVFVLPKITVARGTRLAILNNRLRDPFFAANYRGGILKVVASKFCRGSKGWRATVDWFIDEDILPRIMEGKYDDVNHPKLTGDEKTYTDETIE